MINASTALSLLGGSTSSGSSTMSALAAFTNYNRDQAAARSAFASSATVTDAIDDFKAAAKKIESVDDLLADRKTLTFVLSAFGLESDAANVGKIRAVLNSDPDDINSYANRLTDSRYGELAAFFDVPESGLSRLRATDRQSTLINDYLGNEFEKSIGTQNEAARDALFFLRRINEVESAYDILADLSLRSIVTDALNLPDEIANQSVEKQAALIETGIDLEAFQTTSSSSGSKSRLEVLADDLSAIGDAKTALQASQNVVDSIVDKLDELRLLYADHANVVAADGPHADEIPLQVAALPDILAQRGLVAAASGAITDTRAGLDRIDQLFDDLRNAEDAEAFATAQSSLLAAADAILGDDGTINAAVYVDPNSGEVRNLLRSGTAGALPAGIDPTDAQLSITVDTAGTRAVTKSTDLAGFLADLQGFRDTVAAAGFETAEADLEGATGTFAAAEDAFEDAEFLTRINIASINNALDAVTFAVELDTDQLALGFESASDALDRAATIDGVLSTIRSLAGDATEPDADLEAINAEYTARLAQLDDLIRNAGTVTDGATTVALDNLLTSGAVTYSVRDGTVIRVEGGDLADSILSGLPATITADNAAQLLDDVDNVYRPALDEVVDDITRDRKVLDFAYSTVDPLGKLDAQVRKLQADLDDLIETAASGGVNLLSPYASDLRVSLGSVGSTITVEAQDGFADAFRDSLEAFNTQVLTGGSIADRTTALNDLLFAAGRVQGTLKAEAYALNVQQAVINEEKSLLEGDGGSAGSFLQPVEHTSAALKFIERYLVQKDLESSGVSASSTDAKTALASQIASILPSSGSGILSLLA